MKVRGYSERGAVNGLLYEIRYRDDGAQLLGQLLSLVRFPFGQPHGFAVRDATVLVEQSLSDFGDADAVMLLECKEDRQTVFLEAKVKPAQQAEWRIDEEFGKFEQGLVGKATLPSSNLFTQLYHKMRFADCLRDGSLKALGAVLFPACSSKERRCIGHNPVVLRAVQDIKEHLDQLFFVALLPDSDDDVLEFFKTLTGKRLEERLPGWGLERVGFLSWESVVTFCTVNRLGDTLDVLGYNAEQIFAPGVGGRPMGVASLSGTPVGRSAL